MASYPTEKVDFAPGPTVRPAPVAALALRELPTELHFRRDHFGIPARLPAEVTVGGLTEVAYSLTDLRRRRAHRVGALLECAGHRRAEFDPPAPGVQWEVGAASEAVWDGLPLRDLLLEAGVPADARTVVFHGSDEGLRGDADLPVRFARAILLEKALDPDTLLAWEMNGDSIPAEHGGPLRVIVPGHYAVDSVKWVDRVTILNRDFDGPFQRLDYRFFTGDGEGVELHALPIHALALSAQRDEVAGIAWGGRGGVAAVAVRVDGGPWRTAALEHGAAWGRTFWRLDWDAAPGAHVVEVRATDAAGDAQPDAPRWNRLGYANNSVHRATFAVA